MNEQQRITFITAAFGTEAIQGVNALIEQGADGFNKYAAGIAQISAAEAAAARINTLEGALDQLGGALQSISIRVGRLFIPEVKAMAEGATALAKAFSSLTPEQRKLIVVLVGVAGAIAAAVGGFVLLAPQIEALGPAFSTLKDVLLAASRPFLLLAGVAALLFFAWQTNLFGVRDLAQNAFGSLPGILNKVSAAFSAASKFWETTVVPVLFTISNEIERRVIPIFNALASGPLGNLGLVFQKAFSGDISGAIETFIAIIGALVPGLGGVIQDIRATMGRLGTFLGPILGNFGLVFQKAFSGDIAGAFQTFRAIINAISPEAAGFIDILKKGFDALPGILSNVGAAFGAAGNLWTTTIGPAIQKIADWIGERLKPAFENFANSEAVQNVGHVFEAIGIIFNLLINGKGDEVIKFFKEMLPQPFKDLGAALEGPVASAFGAIAATFDTVLNGHGGEIIDFFKKQLPEPFKALGQTLEGPVTTAFAAISAIFTQIVAGNGNEVIKFFKENLPEPFKVLGAALEGPVTTAFAAISAIFAAVLSGNGKEVIKFFKENLPESFQTLGASLEGPAGTAINALGNFGTGIAAFAGVLERNPGLIADGLQRIGAPFQTFGTALAPIQPIIASIGNFFTAIAHVQEAFASLQTTGANGETTTPFESGLNRLFAFLSNNTDVGQLMLSALGPFGAPLSALVADWGNVSNVINTLATAFEKFALAVRGLPPIPDWLLKTLEGDPLGAGVAAFQGGQATGNGLLRKSSFDLTGGGVGGGGTILNFNAPVSLNGGIELEEFAQSIAAAIRASAGRVSPPVPAGQPGLVTGVI